MIDQKAAPPVDWTKPIRMYSGAERMYFDAFVAGFVRFTPNSDPVVMIRYKRPQFEWHGKSVAFTVSYRTMDNQAIRTDGTIYETTFFAENIPDRKTLDRKVIMHEWSDYARVNFVPFDPSPNIRLVFEDGKLVSASVITE